LGKKTENIVDFTILYNKYKKRLYSYILKMCMDKMLTDDIMQNVFIKLFQNLDLIKNSQSVHYWLFKTARNEFYSLLRNTKIKKLYTEAEDLDEIEIEDKVWLSSDYESKELNTLIRDELEKVNPISKEIFILKAYSGISYKEIASLLKLDVETVKSRLYKLRQKLISKISKIV
jgi:RNA polymerase sigma-70 factor (ECF subfamily)